MGKQQIKSILNKTYKKSFDKKRICNIDGCSEKSINSHVLQKNGILNVISENGHVLVPETDFFNPDLLLFKSRGINTAFTFKGLCAEHDNKIFSSIEDNEIDFDDYKTQLLFAYRTLLNEKFKKEVILDWHKYQKESNILQNVIDFEQYELMDHQQQLGIEDANYYLDLMESDLNNNKMNFIFYVRYTRPCQLCLASSFTFETTRERFLLLNSTGQDINIPTNIFVCYFPIEEENVMMIGTLKEVSNKAIEFIESFYNCEESEFFKKLSDIILNRCEMWSCSNEFYKKYILPRQRKIKDIFHQVVLSPNEDRVLDFNLFEPLFDLDN